MYSLLGILPRPLDHLCPNLCDLATPLLPNVSCVWCNALRDGVTVIVWQAGRPRQRSGGGTLLMHSSAVVQRSWLAHTAHGVDARSPTVITAGHCRPVSQTASPRVASTRSVHAQPTSTSPNDVHRFARVAHVIASDWQLLLSMHLIISCAVRTINDTPVQAISYY